MADAKEKSSGKEKKSGMSEQKAACGLDEKQAADKLYRMRHSCSHVLAQAVLEMFPEAKLAIGPPIDNGFYYDFDLPRTLIPEDLPILEKKMKEIAKQKQKFVVKAVPVSQAIEVCKKAGQDYKVELIKDLSEAGEKEVTFYENLDRKGEVKFVDLCKGPHTEHTGDTGAFKLASIAGAYWRGSEKNKMLQRIYGFCFENKDALQKYVTMMEEAKRRDHREIGKKLDLFSFQDEGPGFPFFHPKGMLVYNQLQDFCRKLRLEKGYLEIRTPIILQEELWRKSGHWDNYRENMYFCTIDEQNYAVKPMNCPGGTRVYRDSMKSYRDLPLRLAEFGLVHRHELSGVLHGLFRVRAFTQDDAHIYCTQAQIKDELKRAIKFCDEFYKTFGFEYRIELSTRPEKSVGTDEIWEHSEKIMHEVVKEEGFECTINEGDGAFYGPKFDFHIADCIGRTWQCGTIQLDFSMPERFGLEYIGEDGKKHRPVMIHFAIMGSVERFLGILIEHFAGALPTWLAPVQAGLIAVSDKHVEFAQELAGKFREAGLRVAIDDSHESVGKKIRNAEILKIPYMLVIGDKEAGGKILTVRKYGEKVQQELKVEEFLEKIVEKIKEKA